MKLIDEDFRKPTAFLNYKTKVNPDPYTPLGPDYMGQQLWPVTVEGKRIGLSYIAPPRREE